MTFSFLSYVKHLKLKLIKKHTFPVLIVQWTVIIDLYEVIDGDRVGGYVLSIKVVRNLKAGIQGLMFNARDTKSI